VPLTLIAGPANAGKVELLLERYLARLQDEPFLIVPNRADVDRVRHDLLRRARVLFGGSIGTFDDLFRQIARGADGRPVASDAQRVLLVRRAIRNVELNGLGPSARSAGFADALLQALSELGAGLLDPHELDGDLGRLYRAYVDELDRLALWDRDLLRRAAAERLEGDLAGWSGEPVFAYGFEDLTGAEWALLEALAGRAEVQVSLPYEPGRPAFASLARTAEDLATLAAGRVEELPPRFGEYAHPALAHLERGLFSDVPLPPAAVDGAVRFLEGAGHRGVVELVGEELLTLIRSGTDPDRIGVVCPSLDRWRAPLETVLGTLGVPYAIEERRRIAQTPFGHALLSLLRFAWAGGVGSTEPSRIGGGGFAGAGAGKRGRRELFGYLRSPYSGLSRGSVDFVEGRLRGRAVHAPERVEEEVERLREAPLPVLEDLRAAESPTAATRALAAAMLRAAYGLETPPVSEHARGDLRAHEQLVRLLDELDRWEALAGELSREDVLSALERETVRGAAPGEAGKVAVLDLLRARTRRFETVLVLGLEEGSLPRRDRQSPFLGDELRRDLDDRRRSRLQRPDTVARDRYLFYTACTRATSRLYLVREAATDDGAPKEPSPFWDEVAGLFDADEVERATVRRPLSKLTWSLEQAPTERERLRAVALLAASDSGEADAHAAANGWQRKLERATHAFRRQTKLSHPLVLEHLASKTVFGVTELERFADCSSAWLFEREIAPKTIDAEADAMLRGQIAHTALHRFYAGLPKEVGTERVEPERVEEAVGFLRRCLEEALRTGVRLDLTDLQRAELEQSLLRDLEGFVRKEAELGLPLVPRRFEVSFGRERAAPELQRGLDLGDGLRLSGQIDRIDVDPMSARGIVQDYKSGKSAHSARQIDSELRLQIPLYMLVLRDLVGIEPLGGLYRALSGARAARGLLRAEARDDVVPGFAGNDYVGEEEFWAAVETARTRAGEYAHRIRAGDVHHDPKGGECPSWCDLWTMCRIRRP
jgi:ATP-dependent helicase/DNAse subunit B